MPSTDNTAPTTEAGRTDPAHVIWSDDFSAGFSAGGEQDKWAFVQGGGYTADDGVLTFGPDGLRIVSRGTHPGTGEPAFAQTIPREEDNLSGLPGSGDHAKWIVYANHKAASGLQGFDAPPGAVLCCEATVSGRTYGTAGHPFGDAVADPEDDLRLASAMLNTIDPETSTAFDFILTNKRLYAFYGRPNFARAALGDYASFANTVPLLDRAPDHRHHVKIAYDRSAGVVRWLVDGAEALRVDRIGYRLSRDSLNLDEGGQEVLVEPRQLSFGMGLLSLLDGSWPTGRGLVRLSTGNSYYRPATGEPDPQSFVDERSLDASRLFGQGAGLTVSGYTVSVGPAR
ncbi:DUF6081 family protein [Streptomyces polygonati]|uniref:DUF6081 family protein n=1 Tax=Streptomyces polygonati TaxID=1617087 RepID=A0ABV8HHS0_9ACTN